MHERQPPGRARRKFVAAAWGADAFADPYRNLSRRDFPGKLKRTSPPIPPRARQLVELMTWGDGVSAPMTLAEAAKAMNISWRTARKYFAHPRARQHWHSLIGEMRESERPRNFHVARTIRDDDEMAKSAAGNRARIEAARFMEGRDGIDVNVNVGIGVGVTLSPGYLCDVTAYAEDAAELLKQAQSTRSLLDREGAAEATVIDEGATNDASPSKSPQASSPESAFGLRGDELLPPRDSRRRGFPLTRIDDHVVENQD